MTSSRDTAKRELDKLVNLVAQGRAPKSILERIEETEERKARLEAQREEPEASLAADEAALPSPEEIRRNFELATQDLWRWVDPRQQNDPDVRAQVRDLLRRAIRRVILTPSEPGGRVTVELEAAWPQLLEVAGYRDEPQNAGASNGKPPGRRGRPGGCASVVAGARNQLRSITLGCAHVLLTYARARLVHAQMRRNPATNDRQPNAVSLAGNHREPNSLIVAV